MIAKSGRHSQPPDTRTFNGKRAPSLLVAAGAVDLQRLMQNERF
jgi:hypothetical protein